MVLTFDFLVLIICCLVDESSYQLLFEDVKFDLSLFRIYHPSLVAIKTCGTQRESRGDLVDNLYARRRGAS